MLRTTHRSRRWSNKHTGAAAFLAVAGALLLAGCLVESAGDAPEELDTVDLAAVTCRPGEALEKKSCAYTLGSASAGICSEVTVTTKDGGADANADAGDAGSTTTTCRLHCSCAWNTAAADCGGGRLITSACAANDFSTAPSAAVDCDLCGAGADTEERDLECIDICNAEKPKKQYACCMPPA